MLTNKKWFNLSIYLVYLLSLILSFYGFYGELLIFCGLMIPLLSLNWWVKVKIKQKKYKDKYELLKFSDSRFLISLLIFLLNSIFSFIIFYIFYVIFYYV